MAGFDLRPGTCAARVPSVDTRNNPPAHLAAICFPVLPVFFVAHRIVAPFAMDKQNREVNDVEVWQRVFEPGRQNTTPAPSLGRPDNSYAARFPTIRKSAAASRGSVLM